MRGCTEALRWLALERAFEREASAHSEKIIKWNASRAQYREVLNWKEIMAN